MKKILHQAQHASKHRISYLSNSWLGFLAWIIKVLLFPYTIYIRSYTACAFVCLQTITQEMRFCGIAFAVIGLVGLVTIIQETLFLRSRSCNHRLTGYSLRLFEDCIPPVPLVHSCHLSGTFYNHPKDALLQSRSCSHQSTGYGLNHPREAFFYRLCSCQSTRQGLPKDALLQNCSCRYKSIGYGHNHPRNAFFYHSCNWQSIRYGVQSSKGRASPSTGCVVFSLLSTVIFIQERPSSTARAVFSLSDTVYNHSRNALLQHYWCCH